MHPWQVVASRTQVPLKLAWAITIHKSQGMTISMLELSLADAFEAGQIYVALSRGVSLEGITVLSYDPAKIWVHDKVAKFGAMLEGLTAVSPAAAVASGGTDAAAAAAADAPTTSLVAGPAGPGVPRPQPQPPTPAAPAAPVAPRRALTEAQLQRIREKRGEALQKRNAKAKAQAQLQPQSAPMRSPTTPTAATIQQKKEEALSRRRARLTQP